MKKIVILLTIVAICHITTARWHDHGHNHWGHHHGSNEDREDREVHPPWWRRKPDSNSDEDNSNGYNPWKRSTPTTSSTTTSSAPPVNNDDIIRACVRSCPVTSEYNPVCGSNGVTYANPGRLECAQQCGVAVQLARSTACAVVENRNVSRNSLETCLAACPVTLDFMPVCGTNDVTYANPARLQCVKNCGVAVSIDKYDPCYRWPNAGDSLIQIELTACQQSCPVKVDYVPVCGTDGRTYRNADSLQCARKCGINVNVKKFKACESTANANNCNANGGGYRPPITVEECMRSCPKSEDNKPVCGTNDITYKNIDQLLCAKRCGTDVCVKKQSVCDNFVTPPTPVTQVTPTKEPIDQDKDKATTGFTINPDVLHSLFPDDHTKENDEFDVDERYNDKFSTEKTK